MAKSCEVCNKTIDHGNHVTFAGNRIKRVRRPNLQRVRVFYQNSRRRMWVCTRCIKAGKVSKVF